MSSRDLDSEAIAMAIIISESYEAQNFNWNYLVKFRTYHSISIDIEACMFVQHFM